MNGAVNHLTNRAQSRKPRPRRDIRPLAIVSLVLLVLLIALLLQWRFDRESLAGSTEVDPPSALDIEHDFAPLFRETRDDQEQVQGAEEITALLEPWLDPIENPEGHMQQAKKRESMIRFQQAVAMLHAKRYDEAIVALDRVLTLVPNSPDAHVNRGYALIGKEDYEAAYDAFDLASERYPAQANAYYGMAIALEAMGNLEGALGGMRSFLHLSQDKGPGQIHVARARSAIWEWEAKLERGPWGSTKGVPPGFSEEELKRDGRGVGIKMPIPGTEDENGNMKYEIKHQDKFQLFDP